MMAHRPKKIAGRNRLPTSYGGRQKDCPLVSPVSYFVLRDQDFGEPR